MLWHARHDGSQLRHGTIGRRGAVRICVDVRHVCRTKCRIHQVSRWIESGFVERCAFGKYRKRGILLCREARSAGARGLRLKNGARRKIASGNQLVEAVIADLARKQGRRLSERCAEYVPRVDRSMLEMCV